MKSFLVLSSGLSGAKSFATVLVLVDNWLTSPINDLRSVQVLGIGYLAIASVIDSSTWYPFADSWKPTKITCL